MHPIIKLRKFPSVYIEVCVIIQYWKRFVTEIDWWRLLYSKGHKEIDYDTFELKRYLWDFVPKYKSVKDSYNPRPIKYICFFVMIICILFIQFLNM